MAGMTTRELLEKLYNQDYEKLKGKKLRMTREGFQERKCAWRM